MIKYIIAKTDVGKAEGGLQCDTQAWLRQKEECDALLKHHRPALSSKAVLGGTAVKLDVQVLRKQPPSVLIATPGRLNDLLHNHGMEKAFAALRILILDEADQLLGGEVGQQQRAGDEGAGETVTGQKIPFAVTRLSPGPPIGVPGNQGHEETTGNNCGHRPTP